MSGKAYTLKEMKTIVDYLIEHKAYNEIKGRKMWKDLADSKITNRTWQSLKETFLKRILPDIANPYYQLSLLQISSFKQGHDVETRLNNKLKIRSASQDSNTESEDKKNDQADDDEDKKENADAGEELKQSESDLRASTETLVLENVEEKDQPPKKSLRELITYSEPLTPMLQAVIDDFASDDGEGSNDEPRMQIVELSETEANNEDEGKHTNDKAKHTNDKAVENATPKEPQKQNKSAEELPDTAANTSSSPKKSETEKPQLNNKEPANVDSCNGKNDNISIILSDTDEAPQNNKDEISKENSAMRQPKTSTEMTQNSNSTTDTLLPDNQEGFKGNTQSISDSSKEVVKETQNKKRGKKRANSQENQSSAILKKRSHKEKQSISDTDTIINSNRNISTKSSQITIKENIPEATVEPLVNENHKGVDVIDNTPTEKDQEETAAKNLNNEKKSIEEIENPCLKSVSLYEEQFSNSKYTDSETSNKEENKNNENQKKDVNEQPNKEAKTKTSKEKTVNQQVNPNQPQVNTAKTAASNEVVILKSHSDSHSDQVHSDAKERTNKLPGRAMKQHREKVLHDVFGFSSGVRRRRKSSNKYRNPSRNQTLNISSDSSEWTSDTESEYISPPRGRRNRQTRKYLKPKSARILSLEEEGGLFVMYGKRVYPIVKDGKIIKNYVTYSPEIEIVFTYPCSKITCKSCGTEHKCTSRSPGAKAQSDAEVEDDQEESFWKLKYVEEKKRTAELTKLLKQVQEKSNDDELNIENSIPVLPSTSRNQRDEKPKKSLEQVTDREKTPFNKDAGEEKSAQEEKTVKIKFTKNNEEVQLEGHWSHVNPVLAQVMQLFQKEPELKPNEMKSIQLPDPRSISREQTPVALVVDQEVHEKVNKIESEIFKEIEEREKEKTPTPKEEVPQIENVTRRRGRPRKTQLNTEQSPAKKAKVDETEHKSDEVESAKQLLNTSVTTRRTTRTPKKSEIDNTETTDTKVVTTKQITKSLTPKDSQDDVRYKFPSPQPTGKSTTNKTNKVTKNTRQRKSSSLVNIETCYSPENLSFHSVESTQGYIDSDESPIKMCVRRKKRTNLSLPSYRSKSQTWLRKRSHPYLTDDITSDSSNSFSGPQLKSMTFENSTLKSDVYKSESYQFLMNQNVTLRNKKNSRLERIDETDNLCMDLNVNDQICEDINDIEIEKGLREEVNLNSDSSSVVTLPTSPVLSIVENISISKSMLSHSNDFSLGEEIPRNEVDGQIMLNELIKVDGDVSMPLMEQECGIVSSAQNGVEYHYNLNIPKTSVSESLVNNMNVVNIEDPTLSESIQSKLKDLILDSAKKKNQSNSNSFMNKDKKDIQNEGKLGDQVKKPKKRSSTPRKRQSTRKLKLVTNDACIEEEHMETCSQISRKSCPPMIQEFENLNLDEMNNSIEFSEPNIDKSKGRKKKNIIKVKITRPKAKDLNKEPVEKGNENVHMSNQTDSGINVAESSVFFNTFNNSVDLIHNHSETCLNANECLGDSVEIIQNSAQSILSIDSNSNKSQENVCQNLFNSLTEKLAHELFSNDAQDVSVLQRAIGVSEYKTAESAAATVYHTPMGSLSPPGSLMTEDLSDENREKTTPNATKWYLLSEDEITNTNSTDINQNSIVSFGYGANLNEIFPITCAVPNLSTITEMSKENDENTKKINDDTNTRNDLDSQSLFN